MALTVCCPNCWRWSELKRSATCKKCGTPLILADGRQVAAAVSGAPPAPQPEPESVGAAVSVTPAVSAADAQPTSSWAIRSAGSGPKRPGGVAPPVPAVPAVVAAALPPPPPPPPPSVWHPSMTSPIPMYSLPKSTGVDWVAMARWITIGYGALTVLGVLLVGLLVRHVTYSVVDPNTGVLVNDNVDLGPAMVFAAVVIAVIFAVLTWLIQFVVARIVLLGLTLVAALNALARIDSGVVAIVAASLASLIIDAGFLFVLVMSIVSRPREAYA